MARTVRRIGLGLLIFAGLVLFILWRSDNPRLGRARMAVVEALAPPVELVGEPVAAAAALVEDWRSFTAVWRQNADLRREIERLRAWRDVARDLERENARLRALNNVRLAPRIGFATGEVIADAGGPFGRSVLVNVGRTDGIEDGAAAVDGAGLVGRVVALGERVSRLLLLTDFDSRVPVKIMPSGRRAVLTGDGEAAPRLSFATEATEVALGASIVTSGDGGVFPPDLDVGVVAAVGERSARVRLAADYQKLEFVRVLRWRRERPPETPGELILPPSAAAPFAPGAPILGAPE